MSTASAYTVTLTGVQGTVVRVEVDASPGVPGLTLVGLPDPAVREARDRVRAAITNSGGEWKACKVTASLSPASVRKRGSGMDLALACACLAAFDAVPTAATERWVLIAELGLDGAVRPVHGVLPMVLAAVDAGRRRLVVAESSGGEAALVPGAEVAIAATLGEVVGVLRGDRDPRWADAITPDITPPDGPDLRDVHGQATPRLAVEVAAAGGHHLLLHGSPGAGKSLLAERLPTLLPPLTDRQVLEVTAVHSVAGALRPERPMVVRPPFQAPHHTASAAALVGGGVGVARPGAVSLAHRGVLFLDEAPEFNRVVLDTLRQPMERGQIELARGDATVTYPARFQLVLAANPCPCGRGGGRALDCVCTPDQKRRYAAKLSGPLLDRVDLQVPVLPITKAELVEALGGESSAAVRERVLLARERARHRFADHPWSTNAEVPSDVLRSTHRLQKAGRDLVFDEVGRGRLTARGVDRVFRVAWTLADLGGVDQPGAAEVSAAVVLRGGGLPWAT
ncbi:MAG TPA: YifB family Mg chelatase-like AAA ATPase [Actinomycetes bacterium]|nr:YifB family Mg chelatase-like AAA ATPase [Actinomycetes bacterium]